MPSRRAKAKNFAKKGDNDDDARTTSINLLFHRNNMVSSSSATSIPLSILTKSGSQFLPRDVHSRFLVWRLYILNYKASLPLRLESRSGKSVGRTVRVAGGRTGGGQYDRFQIIINRRNQGRPIKEDLLESASYRWRPRDSRVSTLAGEKEGKKMRPLREDQQSIYLANV